MTLKVFNSSHVYFSALIFFLPILFFFSRASCCRRLSTSKLSLLIFIWSSYKFRFECVCLLKWCITARIIMSKFFHLRSQVVLVDKTVRIWRFVDRLIWRRNCKNREQTLVRRTSMIGQIGSAVAKWLKNALLRKNYLRKINVKYWSSMNAGNWMLDSEWKVYAEIIDLINY